MSGSTIAIIYGTVLVIFFILLIVLTVTLIISKSKGENEEFDEEKDGYEYDLFLQEEEVKKDVWSADEMSESMDVSEEVSGEEPDLDSAFGELDSAFAEDSAFSEKDSAFSENDSVFTDEEITLMGQTDELKSDDAGLDSAFAEIDSVFAEDSAFAESEDVSAKLDSAFAESEDISVESDSAFAESEDVSVESDSAFVESEDVSAKLDSAFAENEDASVESDSAFAENEDVSEESDSAFADIDDIFDEEELTKDTEDLSKAFAEVASVLDETEPVATDMDSAFTESDSAFTESDSAFTEPDSAFAEPDSAFAEQDNTIIDSTDNLQAEQNYSNLELDNLEDSAFGVQNDEDELTNDDINVSVKEAVALSEAITEKKSFFSPSGKKRTPSSVPSTDDFYWYNKMDVAEKPSYKTAEMYYHHFNIAKDCIEDLLMEMYDCALVRTEEIKYIAYGIEPRAVSMKEILTSGNRNYTTQAKLKEPTTQDLVKIYEKWCGYVDKLFDKIYIHADEYTINEIRALLCEFGRNDVDVLIEGM